MRLLGLTGKAGSGKDTAAIALRSLGFVRVAFADPIRDMLRALGVSEEHMSGPAKEMPVPHLGLSYRRLAQTLGTEWGRTLDPDFWIRVARERIACQLGHSPVVVTDVRFDNEARLIREMGGALLQIERPGIPAVAAHVSEAGVDPEFVHAVVFNDTALDQFERRIEAVARGLLSPRHFARLRQEMH